MNNRNQSKIKLSDNNDKDKDFTQTNILSAWEIIPMWYILLQF